MQYILVLKLVGLIIVANGTPVILKRLLGDTFSYPLDGGKTFFDGQPIFGKSKTLRGTIFAVSATTFVAPILGLD